MNRLTLELRIIGLNPLYISGFMVGVFALIAIIGGELLNLSYIGFEIIFPFFTAIAVAEWGKFRADANFDIIAAQGKSFFKWVVIRFIIIFILVSLFAVTAMIIVSAIRGEIALLEIMFIYISTAFLLSTISVLSALYFEQAHIATMICGMIWFIPMLTRELLRIPYIEYIYLFIRFAGDENNVWIINKLVLVSIGLLLWCAIYWICKKEKIGKK